MNRNTKKILKIINNKIDEIYLACKYVCKAYAVKEAPKKTFDHITNKAFVKIEPHNKDIEFFHKYNALIRALRKTGASYCGQMKTKQIPLTIIKKWCETIKKGFKEGLK